MYPISISVNFIVQHKHATNDNLRARLYFDLSFIIVEICGVIDFVLNCVSDFPKSEISIDGTALNGLFADLIHYLPGKIDYSSCVAFHVIVNIGGFAHSHEQFSRG